MANRTLAGNCTTFMAKGHHGLRTLSNCAMELWDSDRAAVIRIEILVVLVAICLLFMATFGSWCRRSKKVFIQYGVLGANVLSSSLLVYMLGSMNSSTVKSSMYPFWAISLFILSGSIDSITASNLNDNSQITSQVISFGLCQLYVTLTIGSDTMVFYLVTIAYLKIYQKICACQVASTSWDFNKMVTDYMYEEHKRSGSYFYPVSTKGYHYLVDWPLRESKLEAGMLYPTELTADVAQIIDIERVWLCKGLSQGQKDLCISFSLFHLLRRRFFGFECAESSEQKTHDFVFKGLLSKNEGREVDYDRVFNVIEVELAFMYDFFFTKYAVLYYTSKKKSTIWSMVSATLVSVIAYRLISNFVSKPDNFLNTTTGDVVITVLLLACIAALEFVQVFLYWRTIWGRMSFVVHYIRKKAMDSRRRMCNNFFRKGCCMGILVILSKIICGSMSRSSKGYYDNSLGQFSLLESVSCNYKHSPRKKLRWCRWCCSYCGLLEMPDLSYLCKTKKDIIVGKARGKHGTVKLSGKVKKALVHSLLRTQGVLMTGESSLVYNEVPDLLWACRHNMHLNKENKTNIIMTWHIATCHSEMATLKCLSPRAGGELKFHFDVATILSKYCAYLVVKAPKFLPGNHYDTSLIFCPVAVEAAQFLKEVEDKYEALQSLPELTETSVFHKGVKLGRQLEEMEDSRRWKVLADFWTEMLLYVAPSDNVKEHIECLAKGGEFITHLWALLSHAGILDREQRNINDIENTADYQSCPPNEESDTQMNVIDDIKHTEVDRPFTEEVSYDAALRLWRASSYLDKCTTAPAT